MSDDLEQRLWATIDRHGVKELPSDIVEAVDADAVAREIVVEWFDANKTTPGRDATADLERRIAAALRRAHDAGLERAAQLIDEMADSEDDLRATASAHNDRRWAETHANQAALLRHAAAPAIRALKEAPHG